MSILDLNSDHSTFDTEVTAKKYKNGAPKFGVHGALVGKSWLVSQLILVIYDLPSQKSPIRPLCCFVMFLIFDPQIWGNSVIKVSHLSTGN